MNKIIKEIVKLSQKKIGLELTQFKTLVGANQYRSLYKIFRRYASPKDKVLDWGCGNGHFSYYLGRLGYEVIGFSMEDFLLRPRLEKFDYKYIKGKTTEPVKLPFKNNTFNAVVSVGVLEHVREVGGSELKSLKEIKSVLKSNGVFICYHFPNYYSLTEFLARTFTRKFIHEYRFTEKVIKRLCKKAGLEIMEIERYAILPRNSWSLFPTLGNSKITVLVWNFLDEVLSKLFSPICQNYYFVVRKPCNSS